MWCPFFKSEGNEWLNKNVCPRKRFQNRTEQDRQGCSLDEIAIIYSYITNVLSIMAFLQIARVAKSKLCIPAYWQSLVTKLRWQVRIQPNFSTLRSPELGVYAKLKCGFGFISTNSQTANISENHSFFVQSSLQIWSTSLRPHPFPSCDHSTYSGCKSSAPCPDTLLLESAGRQHAPSH